MRLKNNSQILTVAGFTLAETLAAMMFMAIVLPVVVQGLALANGAGVSGERRALGSRLGSSLLNESAATGQWQSAAQSGTFAPDFPEYRWELTNRMWDTGQMREVTCTVYFNVQGQPHDVVLTTLVSTSQ